MNKKALNSNLIYEEVNDFHSLLNKTLVERRSVVASKEEFTEQARRFILAKKSFATCGMGGSMGGQQFLTMSPLLDTSLLSGIESTDDKNGTAWILAGTTWTTLYRELSDIYRESESTWTFSQKQTGCDNLTIGGAVSVNAHGRGLDKKPFCEDVEALEIIDADGSLKIIDRNHSSDLFFRCIGGYGLFGIIVSVCLRLTKRTKLRRDVTTCTAGDLEKEVSKRLSLGATYGDFQFNCDREASGFLDEGILSTYTPASGDYESLKKSSNFAKHTSSKHIDAVQDHDAKAYKKLSPEDWQKLYHLARTDKKKAYSTYRDYYLTTDGQYYDSDEQQMSTYQMNYASDIAKLSNRRTFASEMITEFYVPRRRLPDFLKNCRDYFRKADVDVFYGTVRWIHKENETSLPWATDDWACTVFNITITHSEEGLAKGEEVFRTIIDTALSLGGKWYLTYQNWATAEQIRQAYPMIDQWLEDKRKFDPHQIFTSNWHQNLLTKLSAKKEITKQETSKGESNKEERGKGKVAKVQQRREKMMNKFTSTASVIILSMTCLGYDHRNLVTRKSHTLWKKVFEIAAPFGKQILWLIKKNWLRKILYTLEWLLLPGISLHFAHRKKWLAQKAADFARNTGDVWYFGSGADPAACELASRFPHRNIVEFDRNASVEMKKKFLTLQGLKLANHQLAALDLESLPPSDLAQKDARNCTAFMTSDSPFLKSQSGPVMWVMEGVCMYLSVESFEDILIEFKNRNEKGELIFSFMNIQKNGLPGFHSTRGILWLTTWLRLKKEPFKWGMSEVEMFDFLYRRGFDIVEVFHSSTKCRKALSGEVFFRIKKQTTNDDNFDEPLVRS